MKKNLLFFFCFIFFGVTQAQQSDTLVRSVGIYYSPSVASRILSGNTESGDPVFGSSFGYRFINKISKGFFIEGGVGIGIFGGKYPEEERTWTQCNYFEPSVIHHYTSQYTEKEIDWLVPFLVGYKTMSGKVRFQGSLGIAFALRNHIFEKYKVTDGTPPFYGDEVTKEHYQNLGTSFYAIARAGISIPVKKRLNIEILPTARYRMFYFTTGYLDLTQTIENRESLWSLGIDIGLMISINNKEPEKLYDTDPGSSREHSYTMQYNEPDTTVSLKKKQLKIGPKNAVYVEIGGNGMFYSLNYERTVFSKNKANIQARGGFGYALGKFAVPLGGNITIGFLQRKFEAGLTCTLGNFNPDADHRIEHFESPNDAFNLTIDPSLAFRLESKKHLFLRIAVMTHYFPTSGAVFPGFGVSIGGCF